MKYTISFDASVKIKKNDIKGYLNHCARDTLDKDLNHKNKNINKALTDNNITLYNTGDDFEDCDSMEQIEDYINHRLTSVKKKLRKDAVIMRPLLLQLDPAYTDTHNEEEVMTQASNMMDWAVDTFGRDNIAFLSIHNDETNPHIHVGFMPVTDDGRLSQKEWFKNPQALRKMHDDLRDHMIANGYDATKERVSGARKRLTDEEYKAYMRLEDKEVDLHIYENKLKIKASKIDSKEKELQEREKSIDNAEKSLEIRLENFEWQKKAYLHRQREIEDELYQDALKYIRDKYNKVSSMHKSITNMYNKMSNNLIPVNQRQQVLEQVKTIKKDTDSSTKQLLTDKEKDVQKVEKVKREANKPQRRPLSEGLDWSGYDKDDYDFSL